MATTDDRVVGLEFDNANFQAKIADTLKGLDKLNEKLDFSNAQKNLGDLDNAGKKFSLGGIGDAAEGVSTKFLAMATVGITALSNIANRAVNAGLSVAKSFTVEPITQGFENFQNKMTSISTILANTASKGTKLGDVQDALGNLNTYANQTIYDFSQMTQNLGTFTAAGVDLKTSQESIKGIANVAAISGSNTQQASTAMYQLSQAMAAGQVHLQDWNSVVNAGMGGQVFQKALFDTGVALKAIPGVPVGTSFEDWTKKGNSFRESLQSGWLSTKVLTTTLNAFSGDYNNAQLKQLGYSAQQATAMEALGKSGLQAATQIKSLSALTDMLKENTAAGWAQTFQLLTGNYDETVGLFTSIGNALGGIVQRSSDARNALLSGWAALGGRTELINAFKDGIKALGEVIAPIKEAFRAFFPPATAASLKSLTDTFASLTAWLHPLPETVDRIRRVFMGVFSVVDIVINVFIELKDAVYNLIGDLRPAGDGIFGMAANLGDLASKADDFLVNGGRLHAFFLIIDHAVDLAVSSIRNFGETISKLFDGFDLPKVKTVEEATTRVGQRLIFLEEVGKRLQEVWKRLSPVFEGVKNVLTGLWAYVSKWFSELGHNIAAAMRPGDFNGAVDILNVGLVGGIALMLHKFISSFSLDKLTGGLFEQVKDSLDSVTKTLSAMQAQLKAKALMEIAIALGVLTASIVVLSLINSASLSKAMVAITFGFGELIGAMTALDKVVGSSQEAAKMAIIAVGLNLLATSMVTMATAVKIMSTMSWGDIVKGLAGIAGALGLLIGAVEIMPVGQMISAGLAMIPLSTGIVILAGAVKLFATMSWAEMAKGLVGLAGGLLIVALATQAMSPTGVLAAGIAMIPLATGLTILAGAVALFGHMSWETMGKGLLGVAGALIIIAGAMTLMPITLPITAAGLILVGIGLAGIAGAVKLMGNMDFGTMAKGIGGLAVMLVILGGALTVMQGTIAGAVALGIAAISLDVLSKVLITLGHQNISILAIGLGAIAAVLGVLGIAALLLEPAIPALLGLGIALGLIGGSFALFGAGALLTAKALQAMATAGVAGVKAMIQAAILIIQAVPTFIKALIANITESAKEFIQAGATLLKIATVFLLQILDTVIKLAPKIAEAIGAIISSAIVLIRKKFPEMLETGFELLGQFLFGVLKHEDDIINTALLIMVRFIKRITDSVDMLVNAGVNLIVAFVQAMSARIGDIEGLGLDILLGLIRGIVNNIIHIVETVGQLVSRFVTAIGDEATKFADAGANAVVHFIEGLGRDAQKVADKGTDVAISFLNGVSGDVLRFTNAAGDTIVHFLNALADSINTHSEEIRKAGLRVADAIISGITGGISDKAGDVLGSLTSLAKGGVDAFLHAIHAKSPSKDYMDAAGYMIAGLTTVIDNDKLVEASTINHAERIVAAFHDTLSKVHDLSGLDASPVITPVLDLSRIKASAQDISKLMSGSTITPDVSAERANVIAKTTSTPNIVQQTEVPASKDVSFTQNIYSPKALSTADVYRNTRSQLALAKEELKIP